MNLFRDKRGEMAEAAITTPIVILLMIAMLNLGMVIAAQQAAQNAANYGARIGSVAQNHQAARAVLAAKQAIDGSIIKDKANVAVLAPGGIAGSALAIEVRYQIPNMFFGLGNIFPGLPSGPFQGSARATFRQEGW